MSKERMKTNLADAIESLSLHSHSTHKLRDWQPELSLVIAAAKVFSCKKCRGTGWIWVAVADTKIDCDKCKMDRQILSEGVDQ